MLLALTLALTTVTPTPRTLDPSSFVVHEWGTFNQMQDARGMSVDGMQHEDEELPDFVVKRLPRTPSPFRAYGDDSCLVRASRTNTKMETPVLYFYSAKERRAVVDVTFQGGLLTEWFPRAEATPALDPHMTRADVAGTPKSSLRWDIDVLAPRARVTLPHVEPNEPWALARVPNANAVRDRVSGESEGYLFYRGLGNVFLPPRVIQNDDGVTLSSGTAIEGGVFIEMERSRGRFMPIGHVQEPTRVPLAQVEWMPKDEAVAALGKTVEHMLVAQGLYEDEAKAMVATWTRTWFDKPGTRWLYLVPNQITDELLPLSIEPKPTELVRVLVGRLEVLNRNSYSRLLDDARRSVDGDVSARQRLAARGRFLEPSLRMALRRERESYVRAPLIATLRQLLREDPR